MAAKRINATSLLKVGILVNKKKTKFVADSGTEVNIIDEDAYDKIGRPKIQECEGKGQLFDGTKVAFIGKGVATFQFGDIAIDQEFYVAKRGSLNLLSISTMDAFGLLDELKKKTSNSAINLCENTNSSATITSKAAEKFRRKSDLTNLKGCLMYGERVVIPQIFQPKILRLFHKGYPGMKRMKQLARQYIFWPKLDKEIGDFVQNCEPCQLAAKAPIKTDLHSWPKPTGPWQRIHIDFAWPFFGKIFLIVVDSFSKYPEVFEMANSSATATIEKLRYLFTRHGIPETIVSDNGTQFSSSEFAKFVAANGITHLFSAPDNPMSNGQVERFVDTFKRAFRKLKGEGRPNKEITDTFLITYRTTPNDSLPELKCPAELLLGRRPRTTTDFLRPPPHQPFEIDSEMERQFNRRFGTKNRGFVLDEKVFARHRSSQHWKAGVISGTSGVIFEVKFPDGSFGRFHANQLRNRKTADNYDQTLAILNETFDLPLPPALSKQPSAAENANLGPNTDINS